MTPEEIKKLIQTTIKGEIKYFWLYIIISGLLAVSTTLSTEYLKTKGKNIATKQDIEELTRKVEVVKGGQQLRFKKINEFYDKTIYLKSLLITIKNEPSNSNRFGDLFEKTKGLLIAINSDVIFSKILLEESQIIERDYNSWVKSIEGVRNSGQTNFSINFDKTFETIDKIQEKILNN